MKTPLLQKFESDGQPFLEFPEGILLVKYDLSGQIVSRITADYAKQYEKEQRWEAKNNVVAVNAHGDTLKTEHLIWEEKAGKIHSDKFVKIVRPDQVITGVGFESDQYMKNWRILDPKGPLYIDMEKTTPKNETEPQISEKPSETRKPVQFDDKER
jgi:LPS export ABC transporter protein LptC